MWKVAIFGACPWIVWEALRCIPDFLGEFGCGLGVLYEGSVCLRSSPGSFMFFVCIVFQGFHYLQAPFPAHVDFINSNCSHAC